MTWYYEQAGEQRGPITDTDLENLFRAGTIRPETMVWREGMDNWQSYSQAKNIAGAPPLVGAIPGKIFCAECGKPFAPEEMIKFGDRYVCALCKPIFVQKLREGASLPGVMEYGGFWIRVAAKILDSIILGIPFFILAMFWGFSMASRRNSAAAATTTSLILQIVFQVGFMGLSILYQTFFLARYGATPGKMVAKLRVVSPEGQKIGYGRAFGRACAEMLSGLICYIGYIMVAFDDEKRSLHDRICNTRVIKISR